MCLNGSRGLSEGIERGVRRRGFEGVKTVGFLILFLRLLGSKMVKMVGVSFVGVRVFGFFLGKVTGIRVGMREKMAGAVPVSGSVTDSAGELRVRRWGVSKNCLLWRVVV